MRILTIFHEPVSTIILAAWIASLVLVVVLWMRRYRRVYNFRWYDLSVEGPTEEMNWPQIRNLMKTESLPESPFYPACCHWMPQRFPFRHIFVDLLGAAVCLLFFWGTLELLVDLHEPSPNYEVIRSLGILVGGLSVVAGVFGIFYQGRLKARAENRQAWINSIRSDLSHLIANIPSFDTDLRTIDKTLEAHHITNLDLSLNPSERIHRALIALLRLMHGLNDDTLDQEVLKRLSDNNQPLSLPTSKKEWNTQRCYIIRLSTVLLKREWEQVKHVK